MRHGGSGGETEGEAIVRIQVSIRGVVQGVGFRPFLYRLAARHRLRGSVRNDAQGILLELEGSASSIEALLHDLRKGPPPQARIDTIRTRILPPVGAERFTIEETRGRAGILALIPPDTAICPACRREIEDPKDRRYRYPLTVCTQCGPRYTVTRGLPYDRARTSLATFPLCEACRREYHDPADRRFHAEPIACPQCGPSVRIVDSRGRPVAPGDPLREAAAWLRGGKIVALKGLGGFHLAVDALNEEAVGNLRSRKARPDKPFAVMCRSLEEARTLALLDAQEARALLSPESPIVLLRKHPGCRVAPSVAPGLDLLGIMLPYTPLHHLLMRETRGPLVMTSGNRPGDPICRGNREAMEMLRGIADVFLLHDRDIVTRCDDSVVRRYQGGIGLLRRSRGYVPLPVSVRGLPAGILAVGADQKNTVCITRHEAAFLSQHVGDLSSPESLSAAEEAARHLQRLLDTEIIAVAHDLHPQALSTKWLPKRLGKPRIQVQHHHAHLVSCLAEHGLEGPALGVALDGTGYGTDGRIWGGEIFLFGRREFRRVAHLRYVPLPGGDAAVLNPWRTAASYLVQAYGEPGARKVMETRFPEYAGRSLDMVLEILRKRIHSPLTSSCGRLFDAAAALAGLCPVASYEGMGPMMLEGCASREASGRYPFGITTEAGMMILEHAPIIRALVEDLERESPPAAVSARFHETLVALFREAVDRLARRLQVSKVVLGGGVFQNVRLADGLRTALEGNGYEVFQPLAFPPNDGGLALGQAVVAGVLLGRDETKNP